LFNSDPDLTRNTPRSVPSPPSQTADPAERPEPAQSLEEFNDIVARISAKKLRAPILRKHGVVTYFAKSVASSFRKD
jgi:hypothetical protein